MPGGATDGGAIHVHGTGVPTVVIGVPARHIHSHGSIIHRDDYDNAVKLLVAVSANSTLPCPDTEWTQGNEKMTGLLADKTRFCGLV
jgi:hypothetical protein